MMKQALAHFPLPWLMATALGLFLFAFLLLFARTFTREARRRHEALAALPLKEE